jgi:universal stress protein E
VSSEFAGGKNMPARRVLFAIRDPGLARQPGLAKAIQVARALGATLELFHALADAVIVEPSRFEHEAVDRLRERVEGQARTSLLRLCAMAGKHGVAASLAVEWDRPPHEAIVRRATAIGADLIIAECHKGARTRPWLIHLTDWELLRTSPLPVLLLKGAKPYHRPLVLAAVDPAHSHAKPLALDSRILAAAGELGKGLRGKLHVMHANQPSIVGLDPEVASRKAAATWSTLTFKELQDQERRAFEDFRSRAGVPRTRAHLVDDDPAVAIPRLASELNADIVAMGALSRSGLARVFIGNTAERVLRDLPCDVLVVKPAASPTDAARARAGRSRLALANA